MCDRDRTPHVINCPDGLYWNKERRICDFRSNVVCGPSQTTEVSNTESTTLTSIGDVCGNINCPYPSVNVTYLPSTVCTKYCMCDWFGTAHVLDCPDGLHWNPLLSTCDLTPCEDNLTSTTTESSTTEASSTDTTCDLTPCEDNLTSTTTESSTTEASSTDTTFTSPTTVTSSVSTTLTSIGDVCGNINCPYPSVNVTYFPSTVCTKYCMCDWFGTAHVLDCPVLQ
ncbi:Chitin binding Peritrophin-A domain [Popillia japonica]|uniref:Chitin binding Peritrophin-A domain n=1 Tax=Popillia japonica TaxID=7064 RepID=A0AAW1MS41_POPJA